MLRLILIELDLDFDLSLKANKQQVGKLLIKTFRQLNFTVKEKATDELFYVLKYEAPRNQRQYLKLSVISEWIKTNQYQTLFLPEINRYCQCQTKETMFANKLVALTDRFTKHQAIAGRDLYDIHHFFCQGFDFNKAIIKERLNKNWSEYRQELNEFIKNKITQKVIDEDLNYLLPAKEFKIIRNVLKNEVLTFLYKPKNSL